MAIGIGIITVEDDMEETRHELPRSRPYINM
jgi:hypothetical protein